MVVPRPAEQGPSTSSLSSAARASTLTVSTPDAVTPASTRSSSAARGPTHPRLNLPSSSSRAFPLAHQRSLGNGGEGGSHSSSSPEEGPPRVLFPPSTIKAPSGKRRSKKADSKRVELVENWRSSASTSPPPSILPSLASSTLSRSTSASTQATLKRRPSRRSQGPKVRTPTGGPSAVRGNATSSSSGGNTSDHSSSDREPPSPSTSAPVDIPQGAHSTSLLDRPNVQPAGSSSRLSKAHDGDDNTRLGSSPLSSDSGGGGTGSSRFASAVEDGDEPSARKRREVCSDEDRSGGTNGREGSSGSGGECSRGQGSNDGSGSGSGSGSLSSGNQTTSTGLTSTTQSSSTSDLFLPLERRRTTKAGDQEARDGTASVSAGSGGTGVTVPSSGSGVASGKVGEERVRVGPTSHRAFPFPSYRSLLAVEDFGS